MRVTSSMYYDSIYGKNNSKITRELFDVNKQIASGLSIEYASDDVRTFSETMRLDNEITTLSQVQKSVESGSKLSNQADVVLNDFQSSLDRMKVLALQASNDTQDELSRDAIVKEMRGIEDNLRTLANSSINGQYLFSGSKVGVKPIDDNGIYHGDDGVRNAFVGSNNRQQYNVSGAELFLGEESSIRREVSTNVVNTNLLDPDAGVITPESSLRELMGDIDNDEESVNTDYFYVRGTRSDGTAFKEKLFYDDTQSVSELMDDIGKLYGNTANLDLVNVSLNNAGEIVVEDKQQGSSKIEFHMVGAVDFDGTGRANVDDIDDLNSGESDYAAVANDNDGSTNHLFVKEFVKSGLSTPAVDNAGNPVTIEGLVYDRTNFTKEGSKLTANVSQIVKADNSFATPATKLSEVADLSQGNDGTLDGTSFVLEGTDINGNAYSATIDLKTSGSTFSINGNSYDIYDMSDPRAAVPADEMTYQQLMDVMNMVITDNLPAGTTADDYDNAILAANKEGSVALDYKGELTFEDLSNQTTTPATIALYDSNSDNFTNPASVMTFNTNEALSARDPKIDFFKDIDNIIKAVENSSNYPDADGKDVDAIGIQNAIARLDDLSYHVTKVHSTVGANSNALDTSLQRTELIKTHTITYRSSVIDTDLAEASLRLTQLNTNYQAMLSTVGKVSQLSLVNYLK